MAARSPRRGLRDAPDQGVGDTRRGEGLGLDRAARRQIQQGLEAGGFDPGGADGLFGPRTRAAIRNWQASRGGRATGYLDDTAVAALRSPGGSQPAVPVAAAQLPSSADAQSDGVEGLFWQSIMDSANPADFRRISSSSRMGSFGRWRRTGYRRCALRRGSHPRWPGLEYGLSVDPAERDALERLLAGGGAELNWRGRGHHVADSGHQQQRQRPGHGALLNPRASLVCDRRRAVPERSGRGL